MEIKDIKRDLESQIIEKNISESEWKKIIKDIKRQRERD